MDIARPDVKRKKKIRQIIYICVGVVAVLGVTLGLSRLKPAAPSVDKGTLWPGVVQRGPMVVDVRGLGTLVPEKISFVSAPADGSVKNHMLAGVAVKADTVIMDLYSPQLEQQTLDAEYQLKGAQATLQQTKASLENQLMALRTTAASVSSQYRTAEMTKEDFEKLGKLGLKADLDVQTAQVQAEELAKENDLAQKEVQTFQDSINDQLAVQQATVDQKKALYNLDKTLLDQLHIRAGIDGVLQEVDVEVGQKVVQGTLIAKVANQTQLKAALQIPETQANQVQVLQKASIDTHVGFIPGHVIRIDPQVANGTRTVDVHLDGPLPQGAVPQLSVEGTVEIQRLENVLFVDRPVHGEANSTIGLFRVVGQVPWSDAKEAVHVQVKVGAVSVNKIQILGGLDVGDTVILSDMSQDDAYDRIELK
ncbi:MAG TPA: efflux RND transporter periplasmic adaptor subunit [Candidatus Acidoferrales bacterium]|nr:efflux RND transporter periplasmic adaptor subunit [Candidatus Acidoferrales bacterium]